MCGGLAQRDALDNLKREAEVLKVDLTLRDELKIKDFARSEAQAPLERIFAEKAQKKVVTRLHTSPPLGNSQFLGGLRRRFPRTLNTCLVVLFRLGS